MTYLGTWGTYNIISGTSTGSSSGDASGNFKIYYEYEPSNLRYKISVECYIRRTPVYEGSIQSKPYYVPPVTGNIRPTINGTNGTQASYNKEGYYKANSSVTGELISTQTFYVPVNLSDGTSSVSLSGRFYGTLYGGASATKTCSHTWALPTVPVASVVTNNTTESSRIEFGNNVTFTITPPQNSNYTHTLAYNVGGTDYTIASETSLTTIPYAFPTSLINSFPNTGNPSITVNCLSSNGTTSTTEVFLQVPDTYRPTINSITLEDMLDNKPLTLDGLWIKNKSILKGTISATAKNGASISSYLSSISDFSTTYNTNPFTTQALTVAGNRVVTCQVTDTRNLSKSATQNITVIDYDNPSISSAKVERCDVNGNLDDTDHYGLVTVTYKVYELNDGNVDKNTILLTVKKGASGNEETITTTNYSGTVTQIIDFSLTETTTTTFHFTLTDIFGSVPYEFTLGVAYKTVSKRAGGKGIAFGKVATQDGFDCDMDAVFRKTITGNLTGSATGLTNRNFISPNSPTYIQGNDDDIPTKKAIENWNGAYNSSNDSNLEYCKNGKIGAIVTEDGYSNDTFTCTKTSGGATITSSKFDRFGKVVTVYIIFTVQTATTAGNNAWEGTITDLPLPTGVVTGSAFIGNQPYSLNIDENGNMIIRALTTTLAVNSNDHNISATYVTNN